MSTFRSALVTGATGFIGTGLVRRLLDKHVEVTCLLRSTQRAVPLPVSRYLRIIEVPSFGVAGLRSMLTKIPIDVVFNLASYGVRQDDRDPQQMVEGNVGLLVHLLNAIADRPIIRFIHAGSCSEYGVNLSNGELISETHPLRPTSLYGAAKAASFLIGNVLASHLSIPFVTLRLFGVFGTREAPDRLIPYLIRRLTRNQPVDLTPGEQVRDFLFEDDAVEAFVCAATASRLNSGEVYNVCTGHPTRIHEIGEEVALELGRSTDLLHWGARRYRADEPMWLVGDHRRFAKLTAWRPATSLPAGIRRMISSTPDDQDAI